MHGGKRPGAGRPRTPVDEKRVLKRLAEHAMVTKPGPFTAELVETTKLFARMVAKIEHTPPCLPSNSNELRRVNQEQKPETETTTS